jgi:hypothetical protein
MSTLDDATMFFLLTDPNITEAPSVTRGEMGEWSHPGLPWDQIDEYPIKPFLTCWGYELAHTMMDLELDDEHPAMVSYHEAGGSFAAWTPEPPVGDGWVCISIHDTENGPVAWYARRRRPRSLDQLAEQVAHWQAAPTDPEEIADIFMLVVSAARVNGIDLADVVRRKLAKNRARPWGPPDADGVVRHVEPVVAGGES